MDRGVWQATVHGVTKSWTRLSMHAGTTSRTLNLQPFLGYPPYYYYYLMFWPCHEACGILVPQPGMKPLALALEVQSLNRWTTRESQAILFRLPFQQNLTGIWSSAFFSSGFPGVALLPLANTALAPWNMPCGWYPEWANPNGPVSAVTQILGAHI